MKIKAEWTPWVHDIRAAPRVHLVTTVLFQGSHASHEPLRFALRDQNQRTVISHVDSRALWKFHHCSPSRSLSLFFPYP